MRTITRAMFRAAAGLLAAGFAAAASAQDDLPAPDWSLHEYEAGDLVLMFARPNSGDIPLEFACKAGSGEVEIATLAYAEGEAQPVLQLHSGAVRAEFTATVAAAEVPEDEAFDEDSQPYAHAQIPTDHPLMRAFGVTAGLTEVVGLDYPRDAKTAAEREDVRRFLATCAAG